MGTNYLCSVVNDELLIYDYDGTMYPNTSYHSFRHVLKYLAKNLLPKNKNTKLGLLFDYILHNDHFILSARPFKVKSDHTEDFEGEFSKFLFEINLETEHIELNDVHYSFTSSWGRLITDKIIINKNDFFILACNIVFSDYALRYYNMHDDIQKGKENPNLAFRNRSEGILWDHDEFVETIEEYQNKYNSKYGKKYFEFMPIYLDYIEEELIKGNITPKKLLLLGGVDVLVFFTNTDLVTSFIKQSIDDLCNKILDTPHEVAIHHLFLSIVDRRVAKYMINQFQLFTIADKMDIILDEKVEPILNNVRKKYKLNIWHRVKSQFYSPDSVHLEDLC